MKAFYLGLLLLLAIPACSSGDDSSTPSDSTTGKTAKTSSNRNVIFQSSDIEAIVIHDFNWETQTTTSFTIDRTGVTIRQRLHYEETGDKQVIVDVPEKDVQFAVKEIQKIWRVINDIDTIYVGQYRDEEMSDGVFVQFDFQMSNHTTLTTWINNVYIDSYAALTEAVSEIVSPSEPFGEFAIHYHQYRDHFDGMKRIDELEK